MPSMEESKRKVKAGLEKVDKEIDHDAILSSLQQEIDDHIGNLKKDGESSKYASYGRFRFKSSTSGAQKRKRSSEHHSRRHHHRSHRHGHNSKQEAAHPFPREPVRQKYGDSQDSNVAFRESLFDALADDEGAAYWESVYSQPIHIYPRPTVKTPQGELEKMSDDDYAAYVQAKMWEKKHPHIVRERDTRAKRRRQEEEEKTRRKEEFVRRKQKAAWERAERKGASRFASMDNDEDGAGDYERLFSCDAEMDTAAENLSREQERQEIYGLAWDEYLAAWDKLKHDLLTRQESPSQDVNNQRDAEKRITWPVYSNKPVNKKNIDEFMRLSAMGQSGESKLQRLKIERVRWHPDKMQQRFKRQIGESTLKLITSVFQVVDALFEAERSRLQKAV